MPPEYVDWDDKWLVEEGGWVHVAAPPPPRKAACSSVLACVDFLTASNEAFQSGEGQDQGRKEGEEKVGIGLAVIQASVPGHHLLELSTS